MMCRWTIRGHERMALPGAKQRVAHFEDRWVHDYAMQTGSRFFSITGCAQPASSRPAATA